jgi:septal ring factor EnvC (AmiA/AmiB activator)
VDGGLEVSAVKHETSKVLLWTVIVAAAFFSAVCLALVAIFGGADALGMTVTAVGTIWAAAVPVAIGCYSDKAKAENEIKLSQSGQLEAVQAKLAEISGQLASMQAEIAALRQENNALKRRNTALEKKLKQQEDAP